MRTPGWRAALRLARRDAMRSRGASILVLVLLTLPVLAVTAASVVWATGEIHGAEALDRRLGTAEARVEAQPWTTGRIYQRVDPEDGWTSWDPDPQDEEEPRTVTLAEVLSVVGDRPVLQLVSQQLTFATDLGRGDFGATTLDLADPLADGLYRLVDGRLPARAGEVVVNPDLAERGPGLGEQLQVTTRAGEDQRPLQIVGIVESTSYRGFPMAVAPPGSFPAPTEDVPRTWLVGGGPVTWSHVEELNRLGAVVASRAAITDPPAGSELPPEVAHLESTVDSTTLTVAALVAAMVLIEVVLLAGPAFAVSARRQARTLALMAAAGGTPTQGRRVVLASGAVFGLAGALTGVVGGVALGAALTPVAQRFSTTYFGPFDVPWLHLLVVAAFGLASGLLAAVVPAVVAARQDPVAVLNGRRGDTRPSVRSPLIGLVLLGLGVTGAVLGATGSGELLIAGSAVVSVLGMIFVVPVVVVGVSRLARRLPLALRFAARDAARHRTRTVPAVAAVAATVAGVVALGIAVTSDEAERRSTYTASLVMGAGAVSSWEPDPDWSRYRDVVRAAAPGAEVSEVRGLVPVDDRWTEVAASVDGEQVFASGSSGWLPSVVVADRLPDVLPGVSDADRERADAVLARGGAVVWGDRVPEGERPVLTVRTFDDTMVEEPEPVEHDVPVLVLGYDGASAPAQAVVSARAAREAGLEATTAGLVVEGDLDRDTEAAIEETLAGIAPETDVYVERGYEMPDEVVVMQLVLGALGAVLMLGGTLTATFLALSDARPDLATLSAVGAAPRTRRRVAAAYALVVGLVGALLGAAIGFIPGIAISYPLTGGLGMAGQSSLPDHYLDIPWLMVGAVVLGLPLLTAAVVGLVARSRLPLAARLE